MHHIDICPFSKGFLRKCLYSQEYLKINTIILRLITSFGVWMKVIIQLIVKAVRIYAVIITWNKRNTIRIYLIILIMAMQKEKSKNPLSIAGILTKINNSRSREIGIKFIHIKKCKISINIWRSSSNKKWSHKQIPFWRKNTEIKKIYSTIVATMKILRIRSNYKQILIII